MTTPVGTPRPTVDAPPITTIMKALQKRNQWFADAYLRCLKMEELDNKAGFAGIDQLNIDQTIDIIKAAIDAGLSLAKSGQQQQGLQCIEEAIIMATSISIKYGDNTKRN
jgi:hypothetical protein